MSLRTPFPLPQVDRHTAHAPQRQGSPIVNSPSPSRDYVYNYMLLDVFLSCIHSASTAMATRAASCVGDGSPDADAIAADR